jgi:hypothetical protein
MPMEINKVMYFEKRNNLRINVFGLSGKDNEVVPLFVSSNRTNTQFPLIQLLYFKNETNSHYCYIKDSNRLMSNRSISKNDHHENLVCPYCCEFQAHGGKGKEAMEKHMSYCISGQKVQMPKNDKIKFSHFSNINECPIRIYADFETFNDKSMCHKSKNEQTSFNTGHKSASYKLLIVSDIKIDGYEIVNGYYTKSIIYNGEDSNVNFVKQISKIEEELSQIIFDAQFKNKYNIIMNEEQKEQHKKCSSCWLCKSCFTTENKKVKHHNHNTGEYHSALCSDCNIQIKDHQKIPVFFHNLNYDKNVFFTSLVHYFKESDSKKEVSILANNSENFKCFEVGKLKFLDSMAFLPSGLATLIKNVPDNEKHFIRQLAKNDEEFELMNAKGQFPYEWFDGMDKMKLPIDQLKREYFDNQLTLSKLSDEEWLSVQHIIQKLDMKTFEDYHDFYLNIDVSGLADVFENFRRTSLKYYNLDPCNYVGTPSFGWDAMLLKTGVELELLKDSDMYLFYERGIRGGQSVIFNKYAQANNQYMEEYNKDIETSFISYLDANNLYGHAMNRPLPYSEFQWISPITIDTIMNYDENRQIGYTLEVDLHYPKELHDKHNDYPLAPERMKLGICEKLCGTFNNKKDYIIDIRVLKFYLQQGLELTNINRVVQYKQKAWLKNWIDMNTDFRKHAKNDFEKDYFKLMNNSVFGKTMENVRGRIDIKCAFDDEAQIKYQSKTTYVSTTPFHKDDKTLSIIQLSKVIVKLEKPIYAGFTILDLSKLHMYDFHYNTMKPKYGDNIELLMTDTDSFVYKVKTEDFYKDMYENKEDFDMSEYSKDNQFYDETNKKVLGKFKDETPTGTITDFIGVRSKCYTIRTDKKIIKKLKGISKTVVQKNIELEDYKNCVLNNTEIYRNINAIRTKNLTNYSLSQNKLALSNKDDKRVWNGTTSLAYGHWRTQ